MNQPKKSFLLAAFFIFCSGATVLFAQTPPAVKTSEPSFDLILQTVTASNDAVKSDVASSLSGVIRKLKADFPFSNYRLTSTAFQRIGNKGDAETKSVAYTTDKNLAVFSEWTIKDLETLTDANGQQVIQVRNFRFAQRIPVNNPNLSAGVVAYEQIGLTAAFSLPPNTPTVVGSLATSNPNELMFLILTVKAAEK